MRIEKPIKYKWKENKKNNKEHKRTKALVPPTIKTTTTTTTTTAIFKERRTIIWKKKRRRTIRDEILLDIPMFEVYFENVETLNKHTNENLILLYLNHELYSIYTDAGKEIKEILLKKSRKVRSVNIFTYILWVTDNMYRKKEYS